MSKKYLSCAETAKLIRGTLKRTFKHVKFSVRSHVYSGGASIRIRWTDGPLAKDVKAVVAAYEAGGFDGMIDMAYGKESWLLPDGSAAFGSSVGTEGSTGVVPAYDEPAPVPGAVKVHFGADFVFCDRDHSVERYTAAVAAVCERYGAPMPEVKITSYGKEPYVDYVVIANACPTDLRTLVHRELSGGF